MAVETIFLRFAEDNLRKIQGRIDGTVTRIQRLRKFLARLSRIGVSRGSPFVEALSRQLTIATQKASRFRRELDRTRQSALNKGRVLGFLTKQTQGLTGTLSRVASRVSQFAFSLTFMGSAIIRVTTDLASFGGASIAAAQQFKNTAETLQSTAGSLLPQLDKALLGSTSRTDAMKLANFALASGLEVTEDKLVRLAAASSKLAAVHGRDTTDAFQRLTFGIVKQERRILDELGIVVRAADIFKDYADSIGKVSSELDAQEKLQGFFTTVLKAAEDQVKTFTGVNFDLVTVGSKISATFKNFVNDLGEIFVKSGAANRLLLALKTTLAGILGELSDPERGKELFDGLIKAVTAFLRLANVLVPVLVKIFGWIDRIIAAIAGGGILGFIGSLVGALAGIPGGLPGIAAGSAIGGAIGTGVGTVGGAIFGLPGAGSISPSEAGREISAAIGPQIEMNNENIREMAATIRRRIIQPEVNTSFI